MEKFTIFSSKTDGKTPSDVLSIEEFAKIAPYIPPDVLFQTISFSYWSQDIVNNLLGREYLNEMKKLDNDNQRHIVFCWLIGCHLWKWNESIFTHEINEPFNRFSEEDFKKASNLILYYASMGIG